MKSDFSRRFYGQVLVNILYSTLVACLVEIFLIANVDMIVNYLEKTQGSLSPALKIFRMGTATTILYVIAGIGIFSLTFLLLQKVHPVHRKDRSSHPEHLRGRSEYPGGGGGRR